MILRSVVALAMALAVTLPAHSKTRIEKVVSPKGIEAWLVSDNTLPLISIEFAFRGGAAQDPEGKAGVANLASGLLDEGAGDLDARAFQARLEDKAVELSFDGDRDAFFGSFRTLAENKQDALDLLKLAVTKPRFAPDAIERIRAQILASIRQDSTDADTVARDAFAAAAFPGHPYGLPADGTEDSVARITRDDLTAFQRKTFARDNLVIVAVGAIDAETLGRDLDHAFGDLPEKSELKPVADTKPAGVGSLRLVDLDTPQTSIVFGRAGPLRAHEDFIAITVLNHIIGGGTFTSRLFEEVREKRGLSYGVYTGLLPMEHAGLFIGQVATRNDRAREALDVIKAEIGKVAKEPPSEDELAKAKKYLTGSYALRFDSSAKIANNLLVIQMNRLGIDYVDQRNAMVEAVTREDLRRAARVLLEDGALLVVAAGKPQGITGTPAPGAGETKPTRQPTPQPADAGRAVTR